MPPDRCAGGVVQERLGFDDSHGVWWCARCMDSGGPYPGLEAFCSSVGGQGEHAIVRIGAACSEDAWVEATYGKVVSAC